MAGSLREVDVARVRDKLRTYYHTVHGPLQISIAVAISRNDLLGCEDIALSPSRVLPAWMGHCRNGTLP